MVGSKPAVEQLWWLFKADRKDASEVNREFLDWMDRRGQPERPFFAFLNYFDAHNPYEIPATGIHRFGFEQADDGETSPIRDWLRVVERGPSLEQIAIARDAYDDCIARPRRATGRLVRRARAPCCLRSDLGDHHRGPRREFRRACPRVTCTEPVSTRPSGMFRS